MTDFVTWKSPGPVLCLDRPFAATTEEVQPFPVDPKRRYRAPGRLRRCSLVIEATICHVVRGRRLLLKKANRGISDGKWNAPGGKSEPGEEPEQCARREVFEETGLKVYELFYHGALTF